MIKIIFSYIFTLSFILLFFAGCENLNEPGKLQNDCSVLFNLRVNSTSQRLYFYKVTEMSAQSTFQYYFIKNALAELKDNSNLSFSLLLRTDSVLNAFNNTYSYYNYYSNITPFSAAPLSDYFISVKIGAEVISGKTTTPGDFEIIKPVTGNAITDSGSFYTIDVAWERSKNAKGYFIRYFFPSDYNNKNEFLNSDKMGYEVGNDTTFRIQQSSFGILKDTCIIQVFAYDDNYYQQRHNKKASSGINNAYGCFYSTVVKEMKIIIK